MMLWKQIFGLPVYLVWKTWGDKRLKNATWNVTQTCSDFHLWEIVMYNPTLDQRTTLLFTPSLISLDTWQVTHLPLLLSFFIMYYLSFFFLELFIRRVEKGIWIDALTTVELTVSPSARLPSPRAVFKTKIGNPLPSLYIHFHFSLSERLQIIRGEDKGMHKGRWMV